MGRRVHLKYRRWIGLVGLIGLLGSGMLRGQTTYSFQFESVPLKGALERVAEQSNRNLYYSSSQVDLSASVTYTCTDQPLESILDGLLRPYPLTYRLRGAGIYLRPLRSSVLPWSIRVLDEASGDPVAGMAIYLPERGIGAYTDPRGVATLPPAPPGTYRAEFHRLGYADTTLSFAVGPPDGPIPTIRLRGIPLNVAEVVIEKDRLLGLATRTGRLEGALVRASQSVNEDPLAAVRLQPGVGSAPNLYLQPGLHVRGGEPSENLTLVDNVRLPVPTFLSGRSVVNPAFVEEVEFLRGGIPARYGNHLSSVVNFRTRNGDLKTWTGHARQSLWNSQLMLEGPLVRDKVSVLGIVRRSTSDWMWRDFDELVPRTLDLNLKALFRPNARHQVSLTHLLARDQLFYDGSGTDSPFSALQTILSQNLEWQFVPNERWYAKLSVLGSHTDLGVEDAPPFFFDLTQTHLELREDVVWEWRSANVLKGGLALEWERIRGGFLEYYGATDHAVSDSAVLLWGETRAAEVARFNGYVQAEGNWAGKWNYEAGLRLDQHAQYGWTRLSPRMSLEGPVYRRLRWQAQAGWFTQNPLPHLPLSFPQLQPSQARHLNARLTYEASDQLFLALEAYRKDYQRLIVFDRAQAYSNVGIGYAQGLEASLDWRLKYWQVSLNHAWSHSERQRNFQDQPYVFYFDQPHRTNLNVRFRPSSSRKGMPTLLQFDFRYATGTPFTPAEAFLSTPSQSPFILWGDINSERLGASHFLNLRSEWDFSLKLRGLKSLTAYLSLWNVYGHANPIGFSYLPAPNTPSGLLSTPLTSLPFFFDLGLVVKF